MLNDWQIKYVTDAVDDPFHAFHISLDLPEELPKMVTLELIRKSFKGETHSEYGFTNYFVFCSRYCQGYQLVADRKSRIEDYSTWFQAEQRVEYNW